jgi:hypothetical protein
MSCVGRVSDNADGFLLNEFITYTNNYVNINSIRVQKDSRCKFAHIAKCTVKMLIYTLHKIACMMKGFFVKRNDKRTGTISRKL